MRTLWRVAIILLVLCASVFARARTYGYCNQGGQVVVTGAERSVNRVQQSYPQCSLNIFYTGGATGSVTTSGTAVTLVAGTSFNANGGWPGLVITINAVPYTIASVTSPTALVLTASAGTQASAVAYSMPSNAPAAIYSDNAGTAKANPFTSSNTGYWFYYADDGTYDVTMNGGGIPAPFTWGAVGSIDPNSILKFVDAAYPSLSLQQLANLVSAVNGTLYITSAHRISGPLTISGGTTICQGLGAGFIGANASYALVLSGTNTAISGCTVTGTSNQAVQVATCASCVIEGMLLPSGGIDVTGAVTNILINGNTIANTPGWGINSITSATISGRIVGNLFSNTVTGDLQVRTAGGGLEITGNQFHPSTSNCTALHINTNIQTFDTVIDAVDVHDNDYWTCFLGNQDQNTSGPPSDVSTPTNIRIHGNHFKALKAFASFDTLSFVNGFAISDETYDYNGFQDLAPTLECICRNGSMKGITELNAPTSTQLSVSLNNTSNVELSDFSLMGPINMTTSTPLLTWQATLLNNNIHDGSITLQSGCCGSVGKDGIRVQLNASGSSMHTLKIRGVSIMGLGTTDTFVAINLENDICVMTCASGSVIDDVQIDHNTIQNIQFGIFNSQVSSYVTNVHLDANTFINFGDTRDAAGFGTSPGFFDGNPGYGTGSTVTMTPGAGMGSGGSIAGPNCNTTAGTPAAVCSPSSGFVAFVTGNSPSTSSTVFTYSPLAGSFANTPNCIWVDQNGQPRTGISQASTGGTPTAILFVISTPALTANTGYFGSISCHP